MIKNNLWNPPNKTIKSKPIPRTSNDPLCADCPNKERKYINKDGQEKTMRCNSLCPPMAWINGNTPIKEELLTNIHTKDMEYRDYKDDLSEMIEHRHQRINSARGILKIKDRATAILLLAGLSKKEIAELFCMSPRQIIRISNKIK